MPLATLGVVGGNNKANIDKRNRNWESECLGNKRVFARVEDNSRRGGRR